MCRLRKGGVMRYTCLASKPFWWGINPPLPYSKGVLFHDLGDGENRLLEYPDGRVINTLDWGHFLMYGH